MLAGWLVSAWQVSLGFTLGLQYSYLIGILALLALWYWWRIGRPSLPRRLVVVTCAGLAIFGVVAIYQARPYLKVASEYPTAKRTLKEVKTYSSGPAALLSASSENRVWGSVTARCPRTRALQERGRVLPGPCDLRARSDRAGDGAVHAPITLGLAIGILVCSILAMGLGLTGAGYPYRLLYDYAPGWDGVRVPGRVFTTGHALLRAARGRRRAVADAENADAWGAAPVRCAACRACVGVVLLIGLLGEGAGHLGHPVVPQPARAEIGLPRAAARPAHRRRRRPRVAVLLDQRLLRDPDRQQHLRHPRVDDLRGGMSGFPDKASIEKLRYYGIRTVVLHLRLPKLPGIVGYALAEPPNVYAAAAKPVAGLGHQAPAGRLARDLRDRPRAEGPARND